MEIVDLSDLLKAVKADLEMEYDKETAETIGIGIAKLILIFAAENYPVLDPLFLVALRHTANIFEIVQEKRKK
jgi:hypothetical protein